LGEQPRIVVAVGLPGSGKSTYFARIGANAISTDAIRLQLIDDETNQTINGRVFSVVHALLRHRVELGRPCTYIDATSLTRKDRKGFIKVARERGCRVEALWFDTPLEVCKARNAARGRVVPEHVMNQMAAKLVPPSLEEGFDSISIAG
jgi:predicted kinase